MNFFLFFLIILIKKFFYFCYRKSIFSHYYTIRLSFLIVQHLIFVSNLSYFLTSLITQTNRHLIKIEKKKNERTTIGECADVLQPRGKSLFAYQRKNAIYVQKKLVSNHACVVCS